MTAERVLEIARAELGTKESPPNSNKCKYNTAYYGRVVSGSAYPWCAVFVWWCFREAGASALFYNGKKTAYCPTLLNYHKGQGQAVQSGYKPGDIIFFNFQAQKNPAHVGICESWDGQYITTIDGNTGAGNDANGGAVLRRRRHKKYIVGAYRPAYEEEISMSEEQVRKLVRDELARIEAESAARPVPDWAKELYADAVARGITDGSRPMAAATRLETAIMVNAVVKLRKYEDRSSMTSGPLGATGPVGCIGSLGPLARCPQCGSWNISLDTETEVSRCVTCGWNNEREAARNQEKRIKNGEIR